MSFLEYHEGCGGQLGCFGPTDGYYTLFGAELRFLGLPIVLSLVVGVCIYMVLYQLRKREVVKIPTALSLLITLGIIFLALYFSITIFGIGIVMY